DPRWAVAALAYVLLGRVQRQFPRCFPGADLYLVAPAWGLDELGPKFRKRRVEALSRFPACRSATSLAASAGASRGRRFPSRSSSSGMTRARTPNSERSWFPKGSAVQTTSCSGIG